MSHDFGESGNRNALGVFADEFDDFVSVNLIGGH